MTSAQKLNYYTPQNGRRTTRSPESTLTPEITEALKDQVVIFCDMDGVTADTMGYWTRQMQNSYPDELGNFSVNDICQYSLSRSIRAYLEAREIPGERANEVARDAYTPFGHANFFVCLPHQEPVRQALQSTPAPKIYSTDRCGVKEGPDVAKDVTSTWLEEHNFPNGEVLVQTPAQKVETVKHLLTDVGVAGVVFIDDCPGTVALLRQTLSPEELAKVQIIVPSHKWTDGQVEGVETTPITVEAMTSQIAESVSALSPQEP